MLAAPLVAYGQTDADIERKMKGIIVPIIEFRQASATDVLDFLVEATAATAPDKYGIALINTNPPTIREYYTYEVEDGTPLEFHPLTLEYKRTSLYDVMNQITRECGLTYQIENGTIHYFKDGKRVIRKKHVEQVIPSHGAPGALDAEWGFGSTDEAFDTEWGIPFGEP